MAKQDSDIGDSADKKYYDSREGESQGGYPAWMREIEFYFNSYSGRLDALLSGTRGYVAELGAGSCGLSACLSKLHNVKRITVLDISENRMRRMINASFSFFGGEKEKTRIVSCDFNSRLPFDDGELDAVFFDAALHHSRSMWGLLSECHRVLKDQGLLIAQREAYLSPFRARGQIRQLLKTPEIAAKVSENIYLKEQYAYYLMANGFDVEFIPCSRGGLKNLLSPLNGILFTDGVLFCRRQ